MKSQPLFNSPDLIAPNLRCLTAMMWNSDKQIVSFRNEKASASAIRRVNLSQGFIGVCVSLLDGVDLAGAAYRVDVMAFIVVEHVIGIAGDVDLCNYLTRFRVERDKL